jgi:hypothetical protein
MAIVGSISLQAESRGKWHVENFDESENGIVVALMRCRYSIFIKECTVGEMKEVIGVPHQD